MLRSLGRAEAHDEAQEAGEAEAGEGHHQDREQDREEHDDVCWFSGFDWGDWDGEHCDRRWLMYNVKAAIILVYSVDVQVVTMMVRLR